MKIEPISTELNQQLVDLQSVYREELNKMGIPENLEGKITNQVVSTNETSKHIYEAYLSRLKAFLR